MKFVCLPLLGLLLLLAVPPPAVCETPAAGETADSQFVPVPEDFVAVDRYPEKIHDEQPVHPKEAKAKGIEGSLLIKAYLDTTGAPAIVRVQKSSGVPDLDSAAVKAGYKNRYTPAMLEGKPVAVWVSYKVVFALGDKKK